MEERLSFDSFYLKSHPVLQSLGVVHTLPHKVIFSREIAIRPLF